MSCATEKDPPTTTEKDGNPPTPPEPPAEGVVLAVGTACIPIDQIQIGERHRKVVGDIESLKQSIEKLGLLHFIISSSLKSRTRREHLPREPQTE